MKKIKEYTAGGGFLFAMCSATDSFDIALSYYLTDFVHEVYDGTPIEPNYASKVNYSYGIAFENYELYVDPSIYEYSTIDFPSSHQPATKSAESDYFTLSNFSAKWDPIPTMLCQNHTNIIKGFIGQTTAFNKNLIKANVLIMGENTSLNEARYIHGEFG